jgi:DNA-binding IclR family transcriptional regulator
MKQDSSRLNSIEKALNILLAFQADQPIWGVRELSAKLGLSPATVQRTLQTLKSYQFVDQDPDTRQYRLGSIYFQFLDVLQSSYPVARAALPFMKKLLSLTQETVHLNVIEGIERICIDHIESPQHLKASMPIGNRSPLYAGASSKCLLSFSPRDFIENYLQQVKLTPLTDNTIIDADQLDVEIAATQERGYAMSLGERTPGLGSLSAPVLDHNGHILAAVSLAIPELRVNDQKHREYCIRKLREVAHELSGTMGYRG